MRRTTDEYLINWERFGVLLVCIGLVMVLIAAPSPSEQVTGSTVLLLTIGGLILLAGFFVAGRAKWSRNYLAKQEGRTLDDDIKFN